MNYRTRTVHFAPLIEGVTEVRQIMERIRDEASKGIPRFSYQ